MPAGEGDDGRTGLLQADGTLGLDVHLEGAVVLALGWVGVGGLVIIARGILPGTVGLETNSARGERGERKGENEALGASNDDKALLTAAFALRWHFISPKILEQIRIQRELLTGR